MSRSAQARAAAIIVCRDLIRCYGVSMDELFLELLRVPQPAPVPVAPAKARLPSFAGYAATAVCAEEVGLTAEAPELPPPPLRLPMRAPVSRPEVPQPAPRRGPMPPRGTPWRGPTLTPPVIPPVWPAGQAEVVVPANVKFTRAPTWTDTRYAADPQHEGEFMAAWRLARRVGGEA